MCSRRNFLFRLVGILLTAAVVPGVVSAAPAPVFSGERAMALLEYQCGLGPRIPGTSGHRALQDTLMATADRPGWEVRRGCFTTADPLLGGDMEVCNLVVVIPGAGGGPALWLGAHYDTRPLCDMDPDPAKQGLPLPGANDGASGVAILWHLMELADGNPPPRDLVLMFFDGEDSGRPGDPESFGLGSAHLAQNWGTFGSLLPPDRPRGMILLDMVGDAHLSIPMEAYSLAHAEDWTREVFARAEALGLPAFTARRGPAVYDDHIPFLRRGIPAVDLIDFDYPAWHTSGDVPVACSAASLAQVGALVTDLAYHP